MLGLERSLRLDRQTRQIKAHLGIKDGPDLVPGRVDKRFLVLPHHFRSIASRSAIARIEVQVGQPVLAKFRFGRLMLPGMPRAHHRRLDFETASSCVGAAVTDRIDDIFLRRVYDYGEAVGLRPVRWRSRRVAQRHQRTLHRGLKSWRGTIEQIVDAHGRRAHMGKRIADRRVLVGTGRTQAARQRLEIAGWASGKFPVEIYRQQHVGYDTCVPGGAECRHSCRVGIGQPKATQPSRLERGHHTGNVILVGFQTARAHEAGSIARRIMLKVSLDAAVVDSLADNLGMGPRPRFAKSRQFALHIGARDANSRQRTI